MVRQVPCVWVIDDDAGDVFLATHYLGDCGRFPWVLVARDGQDALARLVEPVLRGDPGCVAPDLILLDVNMPRMNGLEFLRQLEQVSHALERTAIIMLTSSELDADVQGAAASAFVRGYLVKPITSATVTGLADTFGVDNERPPRIDGPVSHADH